MSVQLAAESAPRLFAKYDLVASVIGNLPRTDVFNVILRL